MTELEKTERKYDAEKHEKRLGTILARQSELWETIGAMPTAEEVEVIMRKAGLPLSCAEAGLEDNLADIFPATKDIRDKYVLSRLLWDLGLLDEYSASLS